MKEEKSRQYTFGPDEKEILEKLETVKASVDKELAGQQMEAISTKYYSEFVVNDKNGQPLTLRDVFITAERNEDGDVSYHCRWIVENAKGEKIVQEKMMVDSDGKLYAVEGLKEHFGDEEINMEELMAENEKAPGRLKGIFEKEEEPKENKKLKNEQKEENGEEQEEEAEINEDLKEQGVDLDLVNIRKIKDSHLDERMPEVFGDSDEHAQGYSNTLHRYVMLEKDAQTGEWKLNENVEPSRPTWETVISIGENGDKIEKRVPTALMKTNRSDKEIAVHYGQYGEIDIETVDVLPCEKLRIARGIRQENEGLEAQESMQLRDDFKAGGKEFPHELAHQVEEIEDIQKDYNEPVTNPITEEDYIPNSETTWGDLMEETGESLPKLVERYNNELAKTEGKEEPQNIIQRIIEDYQMVSREHHR